MIIDSLERYPLKLSVECLWLCGGVDSKQLRVGEVRGVVVQAAVRNMKKRNAKVVLDLTE